MKTIIDEYGSIILCVIAGTAVLAFLGVLLSAAARFGTAFFDSISCALCQEDEVKQTIENYGRIIVLLAAAFGAVFLIRNTVYSQLKANGVIQDTNHISSNEFFQKQGRPKLSGVRGEDGTAKRLVIRKEEKLNPRKLSPGGVVQAEDKKDGDLTEKIKIFVVTNEGGKEVRSLFESEYLDTSHDKEFILLYTVKNSIGLISEGRIKILVKNYGENHSE